MKAEIMQRLPDQFSPFCNVYFEEKKWKMCGMDEDGMIVLCRQVDDHPYGIIEFENVFVGDWENIYLAE